MDLGNAGWFPLFEIGWGAVFVEVDVVEHGDGFLVAAFEAGFLKAKGDALAGFVAPAAFDHEAGPDFDFLLGGALTVGVAPFEDFLIGLSGEDELLHVLVFDVKKIEATSIEAVAEVGKIGFRQFTGGVNADFIEHPGKVDETFDGIVGGAGKLGGHRLYLWR